MQTVKEINMRRFAKILQIFVLLLVILVVCISCTTPKKLYDGWLGEVEEFGDFYYTDIKDGDNYERIICGLTEEGKTKQTLAIPYTIYGKPVSAVGWRGEKASVDFVTLNCTRIYVGDIAIQDIDLFSQMPVLEEVYWSGYDIKDEFTYGIEDLLSDRYEIFADKDDMDEAEAALSQSNVVFRRYTELVTAEDIEYVFENNKDNYYYQEKLEEMAAEGVTFEDLAREENRIKLIEATFWSDNCEEGEDIFFPPAEIAEYFNVGVYKFYSDPECTSVADWRDWQFSDGQLILYCKDKD